MTAARGFTLVEMAITVAVLAILVSVALPSFQGLIMAQRVRAAASELHASLILARSEAIKRNASVTLTPVSSDLAKGWSLDLAGVTASLQAHEALAGVTFTPAAPSVTFTAVGRLATGSTAAITVSANRTTTQWTIRLEPAGRVCRVQGSGTC